MVKRCLIVTYYFPPTGGGGVQRITKLIKYLSRQNWQFSVVTSSELNNNLPQDEQLIKDIPDNVQIHKVPHSDIGKVRDTSVSLFKSTFFVRWLSSFLFIPDRHKNWIKIAKKEILKLLSKENFDIVLISSPPYSLTILAAQLTKILSTPVILDMRDPWTTNPYKIHPSKMHFKKDRKIEFNSIKKIKYGISAYASLPEFYQKNISNFKPENWGIISNGYDEEDFVSIKPKELDKNKLNIAFSGTFYSHINNPQVLLKAIADLDSDKREKIKFHHVGSANISLMKIAKAFNVSSNIVEWGYRSHNECLNILAGMDAYCFILDSSHPNATYTIGGKVYEYLRLHKPVLALVPISGEAANLINKSKSGIVIDPYNTDGLKKVLSYWVEEFPKSEEMVGIEGYKRSNLAQKCSDFFEKIIAQHKN